MFAVLAYRSPYEERVLSETRLLWSDASMIQFYSIIRKMIYDTWIYRTVVLVYYPVRYCPANTELEGEAQRHDCSGVV